MKKLLALALSFSLLSMMPSVQAAEEAPTWPSWRGVGDTGSTSTGRYATSWSDGKNILWKTALPGKGCSTPIVWGNQIVLTVPADGNDTVMSLDWEGKAQWSTKVGKQRKGKHRNGSGSNPSVVTDGKQLFAYFKSGNLAGLNMVGKLQWSTNLQKRFAKDTLYWDLGTSPVLTDKHVVVAVMHSGGSYVAAFNKSDGELAWKAERNYKTPVECDHSYATPHVIRRDGKQRIIVWGAEHLTSHAAEDGRMVWSAGNFNPKKKRNWVQVASTVLVDDMAIVPFGRGAHLAAVRLGGEGDVTESHRVWTRDGSGFVPTPAVHNGKVFVVRDRGEVLCVDPENGKTIWSGNLPKKSASYYASPTVADGKLYATREDGTVFVTTIEAPFKVLAENDMGERVIASPVPVAGRLLIRGEKHLFCIVKEAK